MSKYQVIIGRAEPIDLVGLALGIPAKIDTGAFRSSIHASAIKVRSIDGQEMLTCKLLGHPCAAVPRSFSTKEFAEVTVRSSNGQEEVRYEVRLRVKLGNKVFRTSFTLADRTNNLFPVLVGRHALKNRFMVNVDVSHVNRQRLLKDFGLTAPRGIEDLEA